MRFFAAVLIESKPTPELNALLEFEGRIEANVNTRAALAGLLANHIWQLASCGNPAFITFGFTPKVSIKGFLNLALASLKDISITELKFVSDKGNQCSIIRE
jgi:hypothetical protein